MASASSTSAKNLFVDSKRRLGERVHVNINNMASVCRQVLRGSQSADLLTKAARGMALQVLPLLLCSYTFLFVLLVLPSYLVLGYITCKRALLNGPFPISFMSADTRLIHDDLL